MNNLVEYLKSWEEFRAVSYNDNPSNPAKGKWTIGYGFTFFYDDPIEKGMLITVEQANNYLVCLVVKIQEQLLNIYGFGVKDLSGNQYDGLISIAYNMGVNAIPKLAKCLKAKNFDDAYLNFFDGIYQNGVPIPGLIYRRVCDAQIFKDNIYECRHWVTKEEQATLLKVNSNNALTIDVINNKLKVQ